MFEDNETPPNQVGIIDFTQSLKGLQDVATFFSHEGLEQAINFSDLLVLVEPPSDWLFQHQSNLTKAHACLVLSKKESGQSSIKTIVVKDDGTYQNCISDLVESVNKPSLVGVCLADLLAAIDQGTNIHFYESKHTKSEKIEDGYLSTQFPVVDSIAEAKGIYIVASLSIEHANDIEDFETIARFFKEKVSYQIMIAYAVRFTINEPGSRVSVIVVS